MDLFNPTSTPKDLAISRAIDLAVEMFISGNFNEADHCFEMAEKFIKEPNEHFTSETHKREPIH